MASLFDDDFAVVSAMFAEALGTSVRIKRRGVAGEPVTAEVVIRENQVIDDESGLLKVQSRDYLIDVANYQVDGQVVEPRKGDIILETIGGCDYEFEFLPIGNRPAYEWADVRGQRWLIRTKKVS